MVTTEGIKKTVKGTRFEKGIRGSQGCVTTTENSKKLTTKVRRSSGRNQSGREQRRIWMTRGLRGSKDKSLLTDGPEVADWRFRKSPFGGCIEDSLI